MRPGQTKATRWWGSASRSALILVGDQPVALDLTCLRKKSSNIFKPTHPQKGSPFLLWSSHSFVARYPDHSGVHRIFAFPTSPWFGRLEFSLSQLMKPRHGKVTARPAPGIGKQERNVLSIMEEKDYSPLFLISMHRIMFIEAIILLYFVYQQLVELGSSTRIKRFVIRVPRMSSCFVSDTTDKRVSDPSLIQSPVWDDLPSDSLIWRGYVHVVRTGSAWHPLICIGA